MLALNGADHTRQPQRKVVIPGAGAVQREYDATVFAAWHDELADAVDALSSRRPVAISGEAGIGKSAFLDLVVNTMQPVAFRGGGLAGLRWHAYAPLMRALHRPMPRGDRLAVAGYVASKVGDGLLVLDDLQWCDQDTLSLLPMLVPRVTLLLAYRERDFATETVAQLCDSLGQTHISLARLPENAAAELVRQLHPELPAQRVFDIVGLAGGNPRLLADLGRSGDDQSKAERQAAAWLDACSTAARDAVCMLALLGRPASAETIGAGGRQLVAAGMVNIDGAGLMSLTHGIVGKVAVDRLQPAERRWRHALLAERLTDPGEIARHAKAAGAPRVAARFAIQAASQATSPAERSRHLNLAASCTTGEDAGGLLLASAESAADAGDHQTVLDLADRAAAIGPTYAGAAALWRARAHLALGDAAAAERAAVAGLETAPSPPMQTALRTEAVRAVSMLAGRESDALTRAEQLVGETQPAGQRPRLLFALGCARAAAGNAEWEETLKAALAAAQQAGEVALAMSIAYAQALNQLILGDPRHGAELAELMAERARADLRQHWHVQFTVLRLWCDLFAGSDYAKVVETGNNLAHNVLPPAAAQSVAALVAVALMDTGEFTRAEQVLRRAQASTRASMNAMLRWARAELAWLTGDFTAALTLAGAGVVAAAPLDALLAVTSAWASWERDAHASTPNPPSAWRRFGGSAEEITAIDRLTRDPRSAAVLFADAAQQWLPRQQRASRRSRWGQAEAQRLAGDLPGALSTLEALREELRAAGHHALQGRVDRSMRAAGRRRGAGRSADRLGLTARERHVLGLVGVGLTSTEIAGRLQISVPTVEGHVRSAVTKLGAANRRQAAAMLASPHAAPADQAEPQPFLVLTQRRLRAAAEADLTGRGWRVVTGFALAGMDFDVREARLVCAGPVATAEDRQAALIAAVRGAGLLVLLPEAPIDGDDEFVADLERLAVSAGASGVDWRHDGATPQGLSDETMALLRALADGATVAEAARRLHMSLRGAHRRLAAARAALGVSTTQQAVVAVVSGPER
jgi:DNA-binding NarL/FixJ family response regulator